VYSSITGGGQGGEERIVKERVAKLVVFPGRAAA
jgi:hypothetical protein